jgi:hypothetical protein
VYLVYNVTISWGLVVVTLPFSLCVCFKVSVYIAYNVLAASAAQIDTQSVPVCTVQSASCGCGED